MVDRDDIDALLIGSLYGELSSADEARLATHLESHPSDRTALADLTRAREAVRESRILAVQLEPPQSISALLMQEAARRAPKPEHDGWFQRFLRSFVAHPAMAAAVMLMVVVGVAGTMYLRDGDQFADQTKSVATPSSAQPEMMAGAGGPEAAPPPASPPADDGLAQGQAAGSETYGVTLGDSFYRSQQGTGADPSEGGYAAVAKQQDRASETAKLDARLGNKPTPPAKTARSEAPAGRAKNRGIVVTTPQPGPKDMEQSVAKRRAKAPAAKPADPRRFEPDSTVSSGSFSRPPPPAPGAGVAMPPAEPSPRPRTKRPAVSRPELELDANAERRTLTDKTARRNQPPPAQASEAKLKSERQDTELAWAKNQHARVSAQVRAGNCQNAANLAVSISNRAPGYYQKNVTADRDLKKCMTYIVAEREREAERVQQRARASRRNADEPAKAAPPPASKQ